MQLTVYTWLVILLVAASFLLKGDRKQNKVFIIVAFILLFAVMGLRDVTAFGSDASGTHGSYLLHFYNSGSTPWGKLVGKGENNYNIGFSYLTKLLYLFTNGNYQYYITIISLFVMISYMRFIKKYSPSPIQSVFCFLGLLYYSFLFDALKQAVAMAILLFAFDGLTQKRLIKFVVFTLLAALIHFPALVFLPAYWIGRMKVGRKYIAILALLLILTYVFRNNLINLMLKAYGSESTANLQGIRFLRNKAVIMIAIVVFAVLIRPPAPNDDLYNALLMFAGIAIIFQTFCGYNNIFERLADYYFHTSIIFIPMVFERGGKSESRIDTARNDQILKFATLSVNLIAIWRFLSFMNNSGVFNPYRFIWQ